MHRISQRLSGAIHGPAQNVNANLCPVCQRLFTGSRVDKALGVTATAVLPQNFFQFEQSVRRGCQLCQLRWSHLTPEERVELREGGCNKITYGFWESRVGDGVAFEYWLEHKFGGAKPWLSKSVLMKAKADVPTSFRMEPNPGTSTAGPAALNVARGWLQLCDSSHKNCHQWTHRYDDFRPTRLVDVRTNSCDVPRICEGASLPKGISYATLSHCWGGNVPMQLKKDNISTFRTGLPNGIPKTFADAIHVGRALGVRYLWIDSLCIIQDSPEDWRHESSRMASIYEHAWCSIAATKAANSSEGLFSDRHPSTVRPVEVTAYWSGHQSKTYYLWMPDLWTANVDDAALMHRGWVTQEVVLAPRILHFASGQIFWECCSLRACEAYPLGIPNNTSFKTSLDTRLLERQSFRTPALQRYRLWQMYVEMYTSSDLSFPEKDKLMAISGLAHKLGPPEDYVAGLWKPILTQQLRWQVGVYDQATLQDNWRAPSWSWASINGKVYPETRLEPNAESTTHTVFDVLDVDVVLATENPFGPVLYGVLELRASLLRTTVYKSSYHPTPVCSWLGDIHAHVKLDTRPIREGETLFCMPLNRDIDPDSPAVYGIVLEPTGERTGEFYRRGVWFVVNMRPAERWVERLDELLRIGSESKEFGPLCGRLGEDAWKQYLVRLV